MEQTTLSAAAYIFSWFIFPFIVSWSMTKLFLHSQNSPRIITLVSTEMDGEIFTATFRVKPFLGSERNLVLRGSVYPYMRCLTGSVVDMSTFSEVHSARIKFAFEQAYRFSQESGGAAQKSVYSGDDWKMI